MLTPEQKDTIINSRGEKDEEGLHRHNKITHEGVSYDSPSDLLKHLIEQYPDYEKEAIEYVKSLTPKGRCFTIRFKSGRTATFLDPNGISFDDAWRFNGSKFGMEKIEDIVKIS